MYPRTTIFVAVLVLFTAYAMLQRRSGEEPRPPQPTPTQSQTAEQLLAERWYPISITDWQSPIRFSNLRLGETVVLNLHYFPSMRYGYCATYEVSPGLLLKVLGWRGNNKALPQWQVIHGTGEFVIKLYPAQPGEVEKCPGHSQFRY